MFFKTTSQKIARWEAEHNVEKIIRVLADNDPALRRQAVKALGRLQNIAAAQPLIALKRDPALQNEVSQALEAIASGVFRVIGSTPQNNREKIFMETLPDLLRAIGRPAMRAAHTELLNSSARSRLAAVQVLGAFHAGQSTRQLIDRLSDRDPDVRQAAFQVLRQFGTAIVQPVLESMLRDEKPIFITVASELIRQLANVPADEMTAIYFYIAIRDFKKLKECGKKAAEPLVGQLSHYDTDVCQAVATALMEIGRPAIPALTHALRAKEPEARIRVLQVLSSMQAPDMLDLFFKKMSDSDAGVRAAAQNGLEERKVEAIALLEKLLEAQDTQLTPTVINLFLKMGWMPKPGSQRVAAALIRQDWDALAKEGLAAVEPLSNLLKKIPPKDTHQIHAVLATLAHIKDSKVIPVLIGQLKTGTLPVREKALQTVAGLVDGKSVRQLEDCLGEPDDAMRVMIAKVLFEHGQPQWKKAVKGSAGDFIALAKLGNDAAVERLLQIVREAEEDAVKSAATDLMLLAREKPGMLVKNWKYIHDVLTEPHTDAHSDVDYNRSSDCTHDDTHSDFGFGWEFPEKPPKGISGPRDF
ncbi:HEAT repeat domain-containing protein [bacterium]|nr:HEAT repeat domain-containing protein [bacterium]